jgi:hypothetical protein
MAKVNNAFMAASDGYGVKFGFVGFESGTMVYGKLKAKHHVHDKVKKLKEILNKNADESKNKIKKSLESKFSNIKLDVKEKKPDTFMDSVNKLTKKIFS